MHNRRKIYPVILIFILLLSFFLRIYKLGTNPLWFDEAASVSHAEKPFSSYFLSSRLNFRPVYFMLLKMWIVLFGENPFALRFLSLIWGVLSVFLIYVLANFMFKDKKIGLISTFLLSISVFHIFHCQQVRQFSFIVFVAIISILYLLKFIKTKKIIYLLGYVISSILLIYTHPYGFCIICVEVVFAVFTLKGLPLRQWFISQLIFVFFVLWWLYLPNKDHLRELVWWMQKPGFNSIIETFDTFSWGGPRFGLEVLEIPVSGVVFFKPLSFIYLFIFLQGVKTLIKERKKDQGSLLSLWLFMPIFISFAISYISSSSVFAIKHLIIALPAFCIISALGLSIFKPKFKFFLLIIISLLSTLSLHNIYNKYLMVDWRQAAGYVKQSIRPGDTLVISTLTEIVPFMYYFNEQKPSLWDIDIYGKISGNNYNSVFLNDDKILIIGIKQNGYNNKNITDMEDFNNKVVDNPILDNKPVWIMFSSWTSQKVKDCAFQYLGKKFKKNACKTFQGIEICYFTVLEKAGSF